MTQPRRVAGAARRTLILRTALALLFPAALCTPSDAQWATQSSGTEARLRGLSAVSGQVAWASGTGGTVLRSVDAGRTWVRRPVPDADGLDFRDIEAIDEKTAYLLSIGEGEKSRISKTTDGGATWATSFVNGDLRRDPGPGDRPGGLPPGSQIEQARPGAA